MSPESYSWEVREAAEELYIIDGQTYDQVASATGVSISQLKRWGMDSAPSWSDRRREYRQAQTSVRRNVMLAKAKLIESVLDSQDPMKAFAFNSLVKSGQTIDEEARATLQRAQTEAKEIQEEARQIPADNVAALSEAIQRKIGSMLSAPGGITMAAIKELREALDLVEKLKIKTSAGADKSDRQLDNAAIQALREQFGL